MSNLNLLPVFLIGLLGSVHCLGMCGGIVTAFSSLSTGQRPFPVSVVVQGAGVTAFPAANMALRSLAYNTGRIGSYVFAGALAGGIAGSAYSFSKISTFQVAGYWLTNLMLVILGLYLMGVWHGLAKVEAAGQGIWKHLQPLTGKLLPIDTPVKLLLLGSVWGWLPCGMVYSVLMTAMMTGSALSGASVMLAFGLGTLPMLFAIGILGARFQSNLQRRNIRMASGTVVLLFGLFGMAKAAAGLSFGWLDLLCLPHA
jgi:sulfite exporter TauE/SafE